MPFEHRLFAPSTLIEIGHDPCSYKLPKVGIDNNANKLYKTVVSYPSNINALPAHPQISGFSASY